MLLFLISAFVKADASVVKIVNNGADFKLTRNGEEYVIRGAGGDHDFSILAKSGGNSVRTWGIENAQSILDNADKNGVTVCLGYWLDQNVNYNDNSLKDRQKSGIKDMVNSYKNHPALLIWTLGNEVEVNTDNAEAYWRHLNDLVQTVKTLDANHPVMCVVAEIPESKLKQIQELAPDLDIIGINSYGGASSLAKRYSDMNPHVPYIVTEFGPIGQWEVGKNSFDIAEEATSTEKAKQYSNGYAGAVEPQLGKLCLGSYVFLWGYKWEETPTWFGMFLKDDSKLAAVEVMTTIWKGKLDSGTNRVPEISSLTVSKNSGISVNSVITASATGSDPDGDALTWNWVLIRNNQDAQEFPSAITSGQGTNSVEVKLPNTGIFRLYAYIRDGNGNAAFANAALQVV